MGGAQEFEFGPHTEQMLKAFQREQGLSATGRVDAATAAALAPAPAAPAAPQTTPVTTPRASAQTVQDSRRRAMTNPQLRMSPVGGATPSGYTAAPSLEQVRRGARITQGMAGSSVTELQQRLARDGARVDVDGKFGPQTATALRQWQAARGVTDTGILGPTTLSAMDRNAPARAATTGAVTSTPTPAASGRPSAAQIASDTRGMSEAQKYDYYSQLAGQNGGQVKTGANQKNIVGLRTPTDADENGGGGRYDDRFVMFWRDSNGTKRVREYTGNTEPSARYRGRMGVDANGDGRLDQGRLPSGFYEFTPGYSSRLGRTLNPVRDYRVDRDTNQDGVFGNDGGRMTGGGNSMLFHAGGNSITGSAGCQTMTPAEYARFWRDVNSGGTNGRIGYTLIEVR